MEEAVHWLPEAQPEPPSVSTLVPSGVLDLPTAEGRPRILLADDNSDMREYVRKLLASSCDVQAVADGEAALEAVREHPPDLILSDVMMPKLDEFGLLKEVRADERAAAVPVILISARAGEESRVEGLSAGADDYLTKPFSARELLARVKSQLAMAKVRRQAAHLERELREHAETEAAALAAEVRTRTRELEQQSQQVRELSWRLLRSQDEERRHIARELHDSAGQTLTVLGINLAQVLQEAGRKAPEVAAKLEQIQETVQLLHREIRTTSYLLHPPLLDESGLYSAISWYVQGLLERSRLDIRLEIPKDFGRLPGDMELVVFRLGAGMFDEHPSPRGKRDGRHPNGACVESNYD